METRTQKRLAENAARIALLVDQVVLHATAHYETDGWDFVVATMSREDIAATIGRVWTVDGAIRKVAAVIARSRGQDMMAALVAYAEGGIGGLS